jgi:hypothetical protein
MKSYNMQALRGDPTYNDDQFQQDMEDAGYYIPDSYKYTPRVSTHVMDLIHTKSLQDLQGVINPDTGIKYTPSEASEEAGTLRNQARKQFDELVAVK